MRDADIEAAADQVYAGFNKGSTKARQTGSGAIAQAFFESVVVRLMKDLGYVDGYRDGALTSWNGAAPARSFWVFRFYDEASEAFGRGRRLPIERYAVALRRFIIGTVRASVCGDDPEKRAGFKVHLVAHSMGGLIARCYLQNICRFPTRAMQADPALELRPGTNDPLVDRLFTYGTPHNGIELLGLETPDLGPLSLTEARAFNRKVMARYLALDRPGRRWDADARGAASLDGAIDPARVFNFIGAGWRDYDLPVRRLARERSDGLVMMANAWTEGPDEKGRIVRSPRAYARRAHGGPFGMVNSEVGYQNLRRFLFGAHRVDVSLNPLAWTHTEEIRRRIEAGLDEDRVKFWFYVDVAAGLRGQDELLHERRRDDASALVLDPRKDMSARGAQRRKSNEGRGAWFRAGKELTLFTGFLDERLILGGGRTMVGHLRLEISAPRYEIDRDAFLDEALPGASVLAEQLRFSIDPDEAGANLLVERRGPAGGFDPVPARLARGADGVLEWRARLGFDPDDPDPPPGAIAAGLIIRVRPHV